MKEQHVKLRLLDDGCDIFAPRQGQRWGYRYGPALLQYPDGRMDAWFASPGANKEADWFTYRHSDDGGASWTDEVVALCPTPDSMDQFSVCDPAAIYIDGWYYLGYTSTIFTDGGGVCNNGFLARSRQPQGPFEKWTGSGWGQQRQTVDEHGAPCTLRWTGRPAPVLYYDEPWEKWGAGELSFVRLANTLYIYYTWTSVDKNGQNFSQTRVATADLASGENWPATIRPRGVAIQRPDTGCDSCDALYLEDAQKFLLLCTDRRFTPESRLALYESDDGLRFTRACEVRSHVGTRCHNCGISAGPQRHVRLDDTVVVGYAYGDQWGFWGTRLQKAVFSLTEAPDFSDAANDGCNWPVAAWPVPAQPWPIHITTVPHFYECHVGDAPFAVDLRWVDTCYHLTPCPPQDVAITDYDPAVVRFVGLQCTPVAVGETFAAAHYGGLRLEFLICVRPAGAPARPGGQMPCGADAHSAGHKLVDWQPLQAVYTLSLAQAPCKQLRGLARYDDGSWFEINSPADGVYFCDYDEALVTVAPDGTLTDRGRCGKTPVKVCCQDRAFTVEVEVVP